MDNAMLWRERATYAINVYHTPISHLDELIAEGLEFFKLASDHGRTTECESIMVTQVGIMRERRARCGIKHWNRKLKKQRVHLKQDEGEREEGKEGKVEKVEKEEKVVQGQQCMAE